MNNPTTANEHAKAYPLCFGSRAVLLGHPAHQSGVVLIVSLIMLLLLTLIGVTSSQVTSLEEKMAGNSRNYNLAFQAAESALRAGEAATATVVSANYYIGSTQNIQDIDWANAKVTTYAGGALADIPTAHAPKYIIELIGPVAGSGGGCSPCEAGTESSSSGSSNIYRITARGMGGNANAVVTLQSIYRR